jgi:hypothetical protein
MALFTYGLSEVLRDRGFNVNSRYKLVRHAEPSKGYDMEEFRAQGWLQWYGAYQDRPIFHGLDYIVVFIGVGGTLARFCDVYEIVSTMPSEEGPPIPDALRRRVVDPKEWNRPGGHYYKLRRVPGFEDLEDRLVIEWGPGARAWHQRARNKQIVSGLPSRS